LSIQLVDSRHEPTAQDAQLHEWLTANERSQIIAATKSDKLSNNKLVASIKVIERELPGPRVIACSAQTGKGLDAIWSVIETAVNIPNNLS
jgi:GTP-binding protein